MLKQVILYCTLLTLASIGCGKPDAQDGVPGPAGQPGVPGPSGASCSVSQSEIGALIVCPDGSSAVVLHGGKRCRKKGKCNYDRD